MFRLILASLIFIPVLAPAALAAPQILGVVATSEPVHMQCTDGRCAALLSAFCLQERRLPPDFDSAYRPAVTDRIFVVATMADGRTTRLEARELVDFRSRYGYTAVEARLSLRNWRGERPVSLALEVGPLAALLPVEKPGDPDPLSAEEIALVTGPWRETAQNHFESATETAIATRDIMRLVNALPASGDIDRDERETLWRRAGARAPGLTRRIFDACGRAVDHALGYPLRRCLEERHERLQIGNTRAFWKSLGGS